MHASTAEWRPGPGPVDESRKALLTSWADSLIEAHGHYGPTYDRAIVGAVNDARHFLGLGTLDLASVCLGRANDRVRAMDAGSRATPAPAGAPAEDCPSCGSSDTAGIQVVALSRRSTVLNCRACTADAEVLARA